MSRTTLTATLALACSLAASAGADSIIRITDNFWSVNGRPIQRIGNLVLWDKGSAFITPQGAFGRNFDTIPGVIPGNPYGMFGESAFGNPGFGDCTCTPSWERRLPSLNSISPDPLRPYRPSRVPSTRGGLGRW
jgi:hypothetical protein